METKYSKFLTVLLIIIIIGIVGLLGYLLFDYFKTRKIEQEAAEFVQTFSDTTQNTIKENIVPIENTVTNENQIEDENKTENEIEVEDVGGSSGTSSSSGKTYKGYNVIGTIEIPKTDIKYPVLENTSRKALEIAVSALYPREAVLNSKGNVVIIGHNYRNGKFFSNNKKLSNGDKIYITDLKGNKVTYIIYKVFEAGETDTDFYNRDTNGAREITLSTCTDDNRARTIIFAKAQGD